MARFVLNVALEFEDSRMTLPDAKDYVDSAIRTECGHHMPDDPRHSLVRDATKVTAPRKAREVESADETLKAEEALDNAVADHAAWEGGVGSEWASDAIVGHKVLGELTRLASMAPKRERDAFLKWISGG